MNTIVARPILLPALGRKQEAMMTAQLRAILILIGFAAAITGVGLKLTFYGVAGAETGAGHSGGLVRQRADIVDRNNTPLAQTIDAWTIGVKPNQLLNRPEVLAPQLARLMPERSEADYLKILKSGKTFVYLRRRALPELVERVNALGETGISIGTEPERLYPQGTLAAHVLGYNDIDNHGLSGMERVLDERLTNKALLDTPVALSIDSRVQAAMESELYGAMVSQRADGATGLVLDVQTGEIIAMASFPVFNPNRIDQSPVEARRNNVTQSVYELGSTFKPLTVAAALDSGVVSNIGRRLDATQPLKVGPFTIKDEHGQRRWLNVAETLVHSSNIATARLADELGPDRMQALFRSVHFDKAPAIELKERGGTIWPDNWGRATVMTSGYGHGIAVTPLHLAQAYAALVNGGIWRPATLLKAEPGKIAKGERVFSAKTSERMRAMLRLIVLEGTGKLADAKGYRVGGKTGTAEKPQAGGYNKHLNVSTFAGVFPMDNPRYVVIAMMDAPKGSVESGGAMTAGYTAAPVVRRVIERTGPMLGVYPDQSKEVALGPWWPLLWKAKGGH